MERLILYVACGVASYAVLMRMVTSFDCRRRLEDAVHRVEMLQSLIPGHIRHWPMSGVKQKLREQLTRLDDRLRLAQGVSPLFRPNRACELIAGVNSEIATTLVVADIVESFFPEWTCR